MSANSVEDNLHALGLSELKVHKPAAEYVATRICGDQVFISGQVSMDSDHIVSGRIGRDLTPEQGYDAARLCGINILAQLKQACDGDLNRVRNCIRLTGFVRCSQDFTDIPQVINGASELMYAVFGECGRHARTSVGVSSLPRGAAVEVDAIFQISDAGGGIMAKY